MNSIALILALSAIIWYMIDRFKIIWSDCSWGKHITTLVAGALSAAVVFSYELDLIFAMGMVQEISITGQVLTILTLMSGSSAVSEIIARIKSK